MKKEYRFFMGTDGKLYDFIELRILYNQLKRYSFVPFLNSDLAAAKLKFLTRNRPFSLTVAGGYLGICVAMLANEALEMGGAVTVDLPNCRYGEDDSGTGKRVIAYREYEFKRIVDDWRMYGDRLNFKTA